DMTASWLAQMGWDVWVLDGATPGDFTETGAAPLALPVPTQPVAHIAPQALADALAHEPAGSVAVIDLAPSAQHVRRHIPGAWFALRSQLAQAVARIPRARRYVLTCDSGLLSPFAAAELAQATEGATVQVLDGGNGAWFAAGLPAEAGEQRLASPRIDRYRRPYEGTDNPREAMQGYLDWEFGLVEQLGRDGTHGFRVI
ncbi:rhodanese-like domain-containing protein, partial [Hydrogenophaga electricum]|uniref:rhodanese-like domain-containing protein n=1 Tax=Hydrogenophaga electricum TaxID=1230953 RepID=UPI0024E128E3